METARLDASGRLVVPAKTRQAAGLVEGQVQLIASRGSVLVRQQGPNKAAIDQWQKRLLASTLKVTRVNPKEDGKWMSDDYARRKLGL